jgi:AraC family transcriptional regulator
VSYITKLNKGIGFIEENLFSDIELSDVSDAAGMSQWHFQRIFTALTGETLKSYIRSRRLSTAMKSLLNSKKRIIEIAIEAGYESQESFTRAFQSQFNVTPGEFRKANNPHLFLEKVKIDQDYLKHIGRDLSLKPEIVELSKRIFVGLHTTFYGIESEKNNMAKKLPELWGKFIPRMNEIVEAVPGVAYGLIQQRQDKSDLLDYFSVMEVSSVSKNLPHEMVSVESNPQIYARFLHKGDVKNMNHSVNFIYSTWLLNSPYLHTYDMDIEEYGEKYHPNSLESEVYYLIPISDVESV